MNDRYPYIRFVIDAAPVIAGAIAVMVLLGGTVQSCHHGGFGGFISFLITAALACVVYVAVMVKIELLRVVLDIQSATSRSDTSPPGGGAA